MKHLVLVAAVGCGSAPAEPLHTPAPLERAADAPTPVELPDSLDAPRPPIDETNDFDPAPHGRWPLTLNEHPELEPHFGIASELAQPGVSWHELCARGAQARHMAKNAYLGEYLAAWCSVENNDYRDAIDRLAPLRNERRLRDAIDFDLSAILVADSSGTSEGEANRMSVLDARVADLTSASYFEVGRLDAALAMSRNAAQIDRGASEDTYCKRLAHQYAVSTTGNRAVIETHVVHPEVFGEKPRCLAFKEELDPHTTHAALGQSWPSRAVPFSAWIGAMHYAETVSDLELRLRFATAALEMAIRTSRCLRVNLDSVDQFALGLRSVDNPHFLDATAPSGVDTAHALLAIPPELETKYGPRLDELSLAARTLQTASHETCVVELRARTTRALPW